MSQITELVDPNTPNIFIHKFPYKEPLIIKTLFLIILFNISFFVFYLKFSSLFNISKNTQILKDSISRRTTPITVFVWLAISLIIFITQFQFIIDELNRPSWQPLEASVVEILFKSKILLVFPLSGVILTAKALKGIQKIDTKILLWFALFSFFILLLFFKNPLVTKRHELGPIIFILIFLFIPRLINSNTKIMAMIFLAMMVGFPVAQLLTHIDYGFSQIISKPSLLFSEIDKGVLTNGYYSLNYDAFLNIGVVIEHVSNKGINYGYQMLSGLFFFVPRAIWTSKPYSSGLVVGNTLRDEYGFNFTNLSNPFISEAYDNFGMFGLVIFSFFLVYAIFFFKNWLLSSNLLKKCSAIYFAMHLLMLLRGDFTNGMSYLGGAIISIYILPTLVEKFIDFFLFAKVKKIFN
ncbi:O-antigen polysaccharide polymerase Wzy [Nonlabens sp. Asnod2-A12]|uniref:O-antigen polysaccharide polymerase Wzy n=1 Tax=Nonlabens sp. Asnod2-A12 TaxID=3160578 RepID=UPI00386BEA16